MKSRRNYVYALRFFHAMQAKKIEGGKNTAVAHLLRSRRMPSSERSVARELGVRRKAEVGGGCGG